jgi:ABC-type transport system involved in cytochrome bd biosynthesis fused ATPase/permease subunit
MDEIIEAANAANAHEFISQLPQGYETVIGERGAQLSGGERQRIAVARAFLKDAPILILDEPTSAIDSKTEAVILDALERLMEGRTTFLIAHRLSTIRGADLILVLDKGHVVQQGAPEDLLATEGLYRQLHDAQSALATSRRAPPTNGQPPDGRERPFRDELVMRFLRRLGVSEPVGDDDGAGGAGSRGVRDEVWAESR